MGEETARLREEIEQTRQDLTRDVDRLAEKTSPSRIVERRVQSARGRLVGLKEKIMGSDGTPSRPGTYGPTYTEDVYDTGYAATGSSGGSRLDSAKESVTGTASHAADSARDGLSSAKAQIGHVGERAQGAVADVKERAEGNPLAAGVVAFGIGWLISSLMPASDAETHAAQLAGDAAREHGGPVLEHAKQSVQEVGEDLKAHAADAASQLKERTQDAAGTVREEARAAAPG